MTTEHTPNDGHPECADAAVEFEIEFAADNPATAALLDDDQPTPAEWVVWCHLHRHYVLAVDEPAPTWTPVPADARTMTRAEAHALANGREWLGHEATPWTRAAVPR